MASRFKLFGLTLHSGFQESKCPLLSATTGKRCGAPTDPQYWFSNMRGAVLFDKACTAVRGLAAQGLEPKVVLEVSPHAVLMPYISENLKGLTYIPCLNKKRPAVSHMLMALGTLFTNGVEIDWARALRPVQASPELQAMTKSWKMISTSFKNVIDGLRFIYGFSSKTRLQLLGQCGRNCPVLGICWFRQLARWFRHSLAGLMA